MRVSCAEGQPQYHCKSRTANSEDYLGGLVVLSGVLYGEGGPLGRLTIGRRAQQRDKRRHTCKRQTLFLFCA